MSNRKVYCLLYRPDSSLVLSLAPLEGGRWRVEPLPEGTGETPPWAGQDLAIVVPPDMVRSSLAQLPELKGKQQTQVIRNWVAREEGGKPEDWAVAAHPLREFTTPDGDRRRDTFLLYARREDVARWLDALGGAEPSRLRIVTEDLALERMYRLDRRADDEDGGTWNLVHVTRERTGLCVADPAGPLLIRQLPGWPPDGEGGDEGQIRRLIAEIDRTSAYVRQLGRYPRPERIVICGDPSLVGSLQSGVEEAIDLRVETWSPWDRFVMAGDGDPTWLPAMVAGATMSLPPDLDLAPANDAGPMAALLRSRWLRVAGWGAVLFLPWLVGGGLWTWHVRQQRLSDVHRALEEARERVVAAVSTIETVKLLDQKINRIGELGRQTEDLTTVLYRLAQDVPPEVVLHGLELEDADDGLRLSLTGESVAAKAEDAQQAFLVLKRRMDESELLVPGSEPHQLEISGQDEQGAPCRRVVFRLEYRIRPEAPVAVADLAAGGRAGTTPDGSVAGDGPGGER